MGAGCQPPTAPNLKREAGLGKRNNPSGGPCGPPDGCAPVVSFSMREVSEAAFQAYWMKASWLTDCCLNGIGSLLPAGVTILAKTVPSIVLLMKRTEPSQKA